MSKIKITKDGNNDRLQANSISLAYGNRKIISNLSLSIPQGKISIIIGPNACGKSTLLKALARLLKPTEGTVILDGQEISTLPTKEVARRLGLLPQTPIPPQGILVADLVARGRTPHQSTFQQWSKIDENAVLDALETTQILDIAERPIDELSGGQRQRVWIAMALAQQTELLLLDEPTTFLDLPHQIDILNLLRHLNKNQKRTIVIVLHDLNIACRYADHIIAMRDGKIIAQGAPKDVVTAESILEVFNLKCEVITDHLSGMPLIIPAV